MYMIDQFSWHCIKGYTVSIGPLKGTEDIFFKDEYRKVIQLGIQAPSGTVFTINASGANTSSQIEIGDTGIFELDFKESNTYITTLHLAVPSYLINDRQQATENFDVIVDILYEK